MIFSCFSVCGWSFVLFFLRSEDEEGKYSHQCQPVLVHHVVQVNLPAVTQTELRE